MSMVTHTLIHQMLKDLMDKFTTIHIRIHTYQAQPTITLFNVLIELEQLAEQERTLGAFRSVPVATRGFAIRRLHSATIADNLL